MEQSQGIEIVVEDSLFPSIDLSYLFRLIIVGRWGASHQFFLLRKRFAFYMIR